MRLGELFAGYGGLGMAVEEVFGAELAWVSEWEAAPSKILAHHWPHVPNHGDVTKIDWANIEPVDIISGGSPCQDLSLAGKRKGMTEGTRSNLWESMREGIATIKPRYVVWENVRGALSAEAVSDSDMEQREGFLGGRGGHLRALGRVLGDLADLGYDAEWRGLRAADVGAPHGRYRIFILATRRGASEDSGHIRRAESDVYPLSYQTGAGAPNLSDEPDRGPNAVKAVADAIGPRLQGQCDPDGTSQTQRHGHSSPRLGGTPPDRDHLRSDRGGEWAEQDRRGQPENGSDFTVIERGSSTEWGIYADAVRRWEAVRGTAPSPVELTPKGTYRLSARFAEWMMGVPPGWITDVPGISRNEQLKACGNGVVPQQAAAALRDMLAAIERQEEAA